jgi:enoyl-[acyl-carrier protein] reductase II
MLKTRITDQYGLKVPFINAGMAFIATTPLVRAVCKAGGMGMLGAAAMPPDVLQAALRDIKAADPACFGVNFIARFSGIEHIEVCIREKPRVVSFFWDDPPDEWLSRLRAAGSDIWLQVGSVDEAKAAIRRGAAGLIVQGSEAGGQNRAAAATFSLLPAVIFLSPPCLSSLPAALPMGGPSLLRWRSAPTRSGWGLGSLRASRPMHIHNTRTGSSLPASGIRLAI